MGGIKFIPASPAPSGVTNANQGLRVNAGFVQLGDPVGDPVTNPMVRRYIQIEEGGDSSQLVFQGPSLQGIYLNDNSQWVLMKVSFGNFEFEIDVFFGKNIQLVANGHANAKMTLVIGSSTFFSSQVYQVDSSNAFPFANYFSVQLFWVLSETRSYRDNK